MYEKTVQEIDRAIALLRQELKKGQEQIRRLQRSREQVRSSLRSLAQSQKRGARVAQVSGAKKRRSTAVATTARRPRKPGRPVKIKGLPTTQSERMVSAWKAYRQRKHAQQAR